MSAAAMSAVVCHHCGAPSLTTMPAFARLHRVASDARPWPGRGEIAICSGCGLVQKPVTPAWQEDVAALYADYRMYHQAAGESEQRVVAEDGFQKRSDFLLGWLRSSVPLPALGRYLDFGCGSGATLRAASAAFAGWRLWGHEPHLAHPEKVTAIPGVEDVLTDLDDAETAFDVITMMHVLEHIPAPAGILAQLAERLSPTGVLFVQVPHFPDNPYELSVADHCSHFTLPVLRDVLAAAGLRVVHASASVLKKEITVVACRPEHDALAAVEGGPEDVPASTATLTGCIDWLAAIPGQARSAATRPFGIFGTSISATWLYSHLDDLVDFFVDEDESRVGLSFLGRPIHRPGDMPAGACCHVALVPEIARRVADRHADLPVTWLVPPPIDAGSAS